MSQIPDRWQPVRKDFIELMTLADSIAEDIRESSEEGGFQEALDFKDRLLIANMMLGLDRIAAVKTAIQEHEAPMAILEETGVVNREQAWRQFSEILKREGYDEKQTHRLFGFLVTTKPGQDLLKCMLGDSLAHAAQRAARPLPPKG